MNFVYGVIFPIPEWYISRFFDERKTVFIKPAALFKYLKPGQKFFFYQSRKNQGVIGEARIKNIIINENPMDFFKIFGDSVFLQKEEVQDYIKNNKKWIKNRKLKWGDKPKRPWIAIELEKIKKYKKIVQIDGFVPISGMYLERTEITE